MLPLLGSENCVQEVFSFSLIKTDSSVVKMVMGLLCSHYSRGYVM